MKVKKGYWVISRLFSLALLLIDASNSRKKPEVVSLENMWKLVVS